MKKVQLGNSDLNVSMACLGTMVRLHRNGLMMYTPHFVGASHYLMFRFTVSRTGQVLWMFVQ
jgi:hypothetical protein